MKTAHYAQLFLAAVVGVAAHTHIAGDVVTLQFSIPAAAASGVVAILDVVGILSPAARKSA